MGKKKKAPAAAAAGTSVSKEIHDLKTLNSDLVKEMAELRKHIEHLRSQLDSLTADRDITHSIERDVFGVALSSTLGEVEAHSNAMETRLLPLHREQDAIERELQLINEESRYSEKAKRKKNWIFYPIAVTAIFFVSTAVLSFYKSSKLKKLKK